MSKPTNYIQAEEIEVEIDKKKWGKEYIIHRELPGQPYATKVMFLNPKYQVSMHFHCEKCETFVLISGELIVEMLDPQSNKYTIKLTEPFSSITLKPLTPHTFYTPDDQEEQTVFMESSTKDHPNDSYRFTKSGKR